MRSKKMKSEIRFLNPRKIVIYQLSKVSTSDEHDSRYRYHLCSHQLTTSNASLGREKVGDPGRKSWEPREKKLRAPKLFLRRTCVFIARHDCFIAVFACRKKLLTDQQATDPPWTLLDKIADCPRLCVNRHERSNYTHHNPIIIEYIIQTLQTPWTVGVSESYRLGKKRT